MGFLLPVKSHFLTLLFLSYLRTGSSKMQSPTSVTQTPPSVTVTEGSSVHMECSIQIRNNVWSIEWIKNGTEKINLTDSNRTQIFTNIEEKTSRLVLRKTVIADSGFYRCILSELEKQFFPSNATWLTVNAITDLMVNQTPAEHISQAEGTTVTIGCQFRTVGDYNSTDVKWYRNGNLLNSTGGSFRIELDLERGFTSLTLTNATVSDSGSYRCRVESRSRNLTGSGEASRVTITTATRTTQQPDREQWDTQLITIGVAAGAGVAILLLAMAGVIMWKHRSKISRSDCGTPPAKEIPLHPSLVSQPSELTYADLRFKKREVQPDAEVIYAEVRAPRKQ
ncbi:uncharacterized protein LOC143823673 [Paroedura picta]|uniref:uncharacterized protein LOC143823673 n=1 Tax=Paroedura picta TaxID=143630 RepID=UPI0040560542